MLTPKKQTADRALYHIKHMVEIIGIDHVGLDFEEYLSPKHSNNLEGFENASKSYTIIEKMISSGFTNEEKEKIAYKDFHRIIKEVLI